VSSPFLTPESLAAQKISVNQVYARHTQEYNLLLANLANTWGAPQSFGAVAVGQGMVEDHRQIEQGGWAMSDAGPVRAPWAHVVEEVVTGMRDWRSAHPTATFADLEVAVEERLGVLRARLLEEAALAYDAAADAADAPLCVLCGAPLAVRDTPARTLRITGDQRVHLTGPYLTCTGCGRGLFPPG
jgi:hypothetical protein